MQDNVNVGEARVVSSQEELETAYAELSANGGGEILLASGEEYELVVRDLKDTEDSAAVAIRSLDSENPAVIRKVKLIGSENITLENVVLNIDGADAEGLVALLDIRDSQGIKITNSLMSSDAEGPLGTTDNIAEAADLAVVRRSEDITFEGNVIRNFDQGLCFFDSYDISVLGNDLEGLQGDGIRIGGVSGMVIDGNHLHDFLGATITANHSDMIQIWGTNINVGNENIAIRNNFLDAGNGANYQMIFGRNAHYDKNGDLIENIVVEHNVIFGAHHHAVYLEDTLNASVSNNTVLYNADAYTVEDDGSETLSTMTGAIEVEGSGALIFGNVAHTSMGGTGNVVLDTASPLLQDDFRTHFVNVEAAGDGDLRDLMLRPDSALNGVAGSSLTWASDSAENLTAVADVTVSATDKSLVVLDAGWSRGPDGYVMPLGAQFQWTFADGSTATGSRVVHDFELAGRHDYTLTVTMPDGTADTITRSLQIDPVVVADVRFDNTLGDAVYTGAETVEFHGATVTGDGWLEIGGRKRMEITEEAKGLYSLASFNLGLTVDLEKDAKGALVHFPGTLVVRVRGDGHLRATLETDDGVFDLVSKSAIFSDGGAHALNIVLDGDSGLFSILVDGKVDVSMAASGLTSSQTHWGLTVGNTWGSAIAAKIKEVYFGSEAAIPGVPDLIVPEKVLGSLKFRGGTIQASDIAYSIDNAGAYTDAGVDITKAMLVLTRENDFIFDAERFGIAFDLSVSESGTSGTILHLYQTLHLTLDTAGQLQLQLSTDQGTQTISTLDLDLDDGIAHRIALEYDADAGVMQIEVDGALVATGAQTGQTPSVKYWGLAFGHPWKDAEASVVIDNITISEAPSVAETSVVPMAAFSEATAAPDIVLNFESQHVRDSSGNNVEIDLSGDGFAFAQREGGTRFAEITAGSVIEISRESDIFFEKGAFLFTLDVRSDRAEGQNVFGIKESLQMDVTGDDFVFHLATTDGTFEVASSSDLLADRDWHSVAVSYSDDYGLLQLKVDGEIVDATRATGSTLDRGDWGMDIGASDGLGFDGGIDNFVFTSGGENHGYLIG